jgi:ATP-binding cassette, subfamily B, bacterial PglK
MNIKPLGKLCKGLLLRSCLYCWQQGAAYLPQEVFLVDDTLSQNIALGVPKDEVDKQRLKKVIVQAGLAGLVETLLKGVDSLPGENNVRISGGRRQRVSLARTLYHQRAGLILDEATSVLYDDTENEIVEKIQNLKGSVTMVVIAHRLTALRHCDRIYCMQQGRVSPARSYEEIAGTQGD